MFLLLYRLIVFAANWQLENLACFGRNKWLYIAIAIASLPCCFAHECNAPRCGGPESNAPCKDRPKLICLIPVVNPLTLQPLALPHVDESVVDNYSFYGMHPEWINFARRIDYNASLSTSTDSSSVIVIDDIVNTLSAGVDNIFTGIPTPIKA